MKALIILIVASIFIRSTAAPISSIGGGVVAESLPTLTLVAVMAAASITATIKRAIFATKTIRTSDDQNRCHNMQPSDNNTANQLHNNPFHLLPF